MVIDNLTVKHVDQSGWFSPNSVVASQEVNGGGGYYGTDGADVFTFSYPDASVWVKEGIQGNGGIDTLKLTKADQVLDLTALAGKLTSVEVIDITGTGNNTLTLSLAEVLENGTVDQFVANGRVQMMVGGNAGDAVSLLDLLPNGTDPGDWAQGANVTIDGVVYEVYQHSGFKADLLVQQGVTVTLQISIDRVMDDVGAITGAIDKGGFTDDTTPTLNGKAAAGGNVKVYDGSTLLGSAVADAKGHWSFTPDTPLSEGLHSLSATVTPVGGNEGARTAVFELTVDTAPTITGAYDDVGAAQGNVASGGTTDDTRPTLSGTGEVGAVVTVKSGTTTIGTAIVGSDGKWSLTPASDLPLGTYNFVATQADEAGNVSAGSSPYGLGIGSAALKFEDFNAMAAQQLPPGTIVTTPSGIKITSVSTDRWISTIRPNPYLEDKQNCLLVAGQTVTRLDLPEGASDIQFRVFALDSAWSTAKYYDADGTLLGSRFLTDPYDEEVIQSFVAPPGKAIAYMVIDMADETDGGAMIDNIQWSAIVVPSTFGLASTDELAELGEGVQALSGATQAYTDSDDTLIARLGFADRLEGGAGNDTFINVGTSDVVHGGAGDDTIRINSGDFARLDGGLGIDTLVMDGKSMHIDLSALGAKVQGFEKFDLGAGGNTLALSAQDLLAGGARDMVTADGKVQMLVNGANGEVNLLGGNDGWTLGNAATVGGVTYSVYTNLAGTAELLVEDKVHVTIL
ncbi:Ig-like domain-containing protein [Variovorax boronicumulans]|uniref:Ig-like domain-containing protein n=1 Tax=Variovorax boronicumulans TaxID=436515 RepID=UPI00209C0CD8|nr:Ig-like domain-containing protein [Variovorax boronicumulans]